MSQQLQAREPADQQGRLRGGGLLLGPFLRERDGGAAVQVSIDVAPAPTDVVSTAHQLPLSCRPGEPASCRSALFDDGWDPLVTEVPAKGIFPCVQTKPTSPLKQLSTASHHVGKNRHQGHRHACGTQLMLENRRKRSDMIQAAFTLKR